MDSNHHMPFCGAGDIKNYVHQNLRQFLSAEDKKKFDDALNINQQALFTPIELLSDEEEARRTGSQSTFSIQNKWGIKMNNPFPQGFMETLKYMADEMENVQTSLQTFKKTVEDKKNRLTMISTLREQIPDSDAFRADVLSDAIVWDNAFKDRVNEMCRLMLFLEYSKPVLSLMNKIMMRRKAIDTSANKPKTVPPPPSESRGNFIVPPNNPFLGGGNISSPMDFFSLRRQSTAAIKEFDSQPIIINGNMNNEEEDEEEDHFPQNLNMFKPRK